MPLTHDQVAAIGADVVRQFSEPLKFIGVMASRGGSTRVEVMVAVRGAITSRVDFSEPVGTGPLNARIRSSDRAPA
jgi:hypothetical protein